MKPYLHKVQYYETDMMGVAHHANYIHWMEEARIDFMDQLGFPYSEMEKKGVFSPVKALSCEYKHPCTFGNEIVITVSVESFNGVISFVIFLVLNWAFGWLEGIAIRNIPNVVTMMLVRGGLSLVVAAVMYVATAQIMEKKLSV